MRAFCLLALGSFCLSALPALADNKRIMTNFADGTQFEINDSFARVSEDGTKLLIDGRELPENAIWTWQLRTSPGLLKSDTDYVVRFRCRELESLSSPQDSCLHFLMRPFSRMDATLDTFRNNLYTAFPERLHKFKLRTGGKADDYAFQIHTLRRLRAEISDFSIEEGSGEDFTPMAATAEPYRGDLGGLPTGAKEFEVERPQPKADAATVRASDFGFSQDAEDNTAALNKAIKHCKESGAALLELAPGTYRMTADAEVIFDHMSDFTLDGKGAKLVFLKKRGSNFVLRFCERMLLRDFSFDWDWEQDPLASVVEVAGVDERSVDFKFVEYERFPRRDVRVAIVSSFDPVTRSVGIEGGFDRGFEFIVGRGTKPETSWLSDNVLRVSTNKDHPFQPGQLFRMQHYYYDRNGIVMHSNRHVTIEDMRIYSCTGHAFVISGTQQYWQFQRVRIAAPEDDPRRVITCTADHCHIAQSRGFFKMEDCEFSLGADDCLNVHDNAGFARKTGSHSVTTQNLRGIGSYTPGAIVELRQGDYSPSGFRSAVTGTKTVDASKGIHEISFADPVPEQLFDGFVLFNWTFDSRNVIVRNCFFHDNRARGLLLLGRDITVENNHFRHNEMGAIKIETGYTFNVWSEGYGVSNVVIRNNRFDTVNPRDVGNEGKARDIYIGVYMKSDPSAERTQYPILSELLFEGNTFVDTFGLVAFISSAGKVTFRDNLFVNRTPRRKPLPFRGSFYVTHASDVRIVNNRYLSSSLLPPLGVYSDPETVTNLLVAGNRVVEDAGQE
jgi:hypothetical protein